MQRLLLTARAVFYDAKKILPKEYYSITIAFGIGALGSSLLK